MGVEANVRIILTLLLFVFVWLGHPWAIKLAITCVFIGGEITSWYVRNLKKKG